MKIENQGNYIWTLCLMNGESFAGAPHIICDSFCKTSYAWELVIKHRDLYGLAGAEDFIMGTEMENGFWKRPL